VSARRPPVDGAPPRAYLPFERPLATLDAALARSAGARRRRLVRERQRAAAAGVARLTPWERVQLARHPDRPSTLDYVARLCDGFTELHGDRLFADDPAIVGGLARFAGRPVVVVGHQRGRDPAEAIERNFGMPRPEGFRKAIRLFELAERFALPVLTFVDTQGAYPGIGAEERGQAEAIARSCATLARLRVPVLTAVIGEGGSGGALALAVADRVVMQEHAWYAVIGPEGAAAILYRRGGDDAVARSSELLRLTAADLAAVGVVDEVVREPAGGAHRDPRRAATILGRVLARHLAALVRRSGATLARRRYARYRSVGTTFVSRTNVAKARGPR